MDPTKIDQALDFLEGCSTASELLRGLAGDEKDFHSDLREFGQVCELLRDSSETFSPTQKTRAKELLKPYVVLYELIDPASSYAPNPASARSDTPAQDNHAS